MRFFFGFLYDEFFGGVQFFFGALSKGVLDLGTLIFFIFLVGLCIFSALWGHRHRQEKSSHGKRLIWMN